MKHLSLLQTAVEEMKIDLEEAISTGRYKGQYYDNGQLAKEALIRSQNLIMKIHEVFKTELDHELKKTTKNYKIYPPLNTRNPEIAVSGFIKTKKQDIVVLFGNERPRPETIVEGPLAGAIDSIGRSRSESSIVVGVRSQLSSVAKNFDTLMERAFAETLNLRLRLHELVMGEVYLLPIVEYDDQAMKRNEVAWKQTTVPIKKFIETFFGISNRSVVYNENDIYKYDRTALIVVDFRQSPPQLFLTLDELKRRGYLQRDFEGDFDCLSPIDFAVDIVCSHRQRHSDCY